MRMRDVMGLAAVAALGGVLAGRGLLAIAAPPIEKDDLAEAITAWARHEAQQGGGTLKLEDPIENKTLALTLHQVHTDRLLQSGPDTWGLCGEFISTDAHTYDVDVYMKGPDKDHLALAETSIHKKDGVERYTLKEEGGVWKNPSATAPPKPAPHR